MLGREVKQWVVEQWVCGKKEVLYANQNLKQRFENQSVRFVSVLTAIKHKLAGKTTGQ